MSGKLMLFWDFDAEWGAERSRSTGGPKDWGLQEFRNTERLLDLHAQAGVQACFAVVGAVAQAGERPYHDPALVRRIAGAGHEIASHAMRHEWLPALDRDGLLKVLRESKDALEQCTGQPVRAFVPPYNQPFDFPARGSISLTERRKAGKRRTDLPGLCAGLQASGYGFVRIAYASPLERLRGLLGHKAPFRPVTPEKIHGVTTLRLNSRVGFAQDTLDLVERTMRQGGYALAYGHPHSLSLASVQAEHFLVPFLAQVRAWVSDQRLEVVLPSQLCSL